MGFAPPARAARRAADLPERFAESSQFVAELWHVWQAKQSEGSLDGRANGLATALHSPPAEELGTVIGRYKLLEKLGEGGFGTVWVAEQREPVKRRVALKVIKLGMDTRQVIARFEAERQALALMDHPNIAKVLDAGADRDRRPVLRDGAGAGDSDHEVLRPGEARDAAIAWTSS